MKSLMLLCQRVLDEIGTQCCASTSLDFKTVERRVANEGLTFLTISLADFGRDFETALSRGQSVLDGVCTSPGRGDLWVGYKFRGKLPVFLGSLLDLVFDRVSGLLLEDPSILAIQALRQFTLMWAKIELECSDERIEKSFSLYLECERQLNDLDNRLLGSSLLDEFGEMSDRLWNGPFQSLEEDVFYGRLVPKHGPGATADKLLGNKKWTQLEWPERLEEYFPVGEYILPNWRHHAKLEHVSWLEPGDERPVRVVHVPKTQKSPRIIAVEPTCTMYTQQALWLRFREYLESPRPDDLVRKVIGFNDQRPNQVMAREGSSKGNLATLDLSEASDRVSNLLVKTMTRKYPHLSGAMQACRSVRADVRGEIIELSKFASMGSALCFPVEALVFTTIVFIGIQRQLNRTLSPHDIKVVQSRVRVYGDDIIVPNDYALSVTQALQDFGLVVNERKSFWTGKFRESCGKEYFDGHDVSICRVRRMLPTSLKDVSEIVSAVSLRNQLYRAGWWKTAAFLDDLLRPLLRGLYPVVLETSQVLGRHSFLGYETQRMSDVFHSPLVKGWCQMSSNPLNSVDSLDALAKVFFTAQEDSPSSWVDVLFPLGGDSEHLTRSGRPRSTSIQPRWKSPF